MLSKVATWIVWSALALFIVFLVYRNNSNIKPAADHAVSRVKSVISHVISDGDASEQSLNQARDAYAKGNIEAAMNAYQAYTRHNSDNADARGELGNVYYSAGRLPEAAQSYYDAANLLIEQKQMDKASALIPTIGQINTALASELTAKIAQAEARQPSGQEQSSLNQPAPVLPQSALRYY